MSTKKTKTPRGKIKNVLRKLWLQSRERAAALKRESYTCEICHKKQSTAKGKEFKVQVHHKCEQIEWDHIIDLIYKEILQTPDDLQVACKACHRELHKKTNIT